MNDHINSFCRQLEREELSPRTVKSYRDKVEQFARYLKDRDKGLLSVDGEGANVYFHFLLIKKLQTANTRYSSYNALKRFYTFLVSRGEISSNPIDDVKAPKKERRPKGSLTVDDAQRMMYAPGLKTEKGKRDTAIIGLLMAVGNRTSSLINLKVRDIRSERMRIPPKCHHCGQTDYSGQSRLRGKEKQMVFVKLYEKGGKTWDVPLNEKAAFYLNQYLVHRAHGKNSDVVFPSFRGKRDPDDVKPITRHGIYALIKRYAQEVGIKENVSPHSFRHLVVTWWLDCGVDPILTKNFVGHSTLSTTEVYRGITHRSFVQSGMAEEKNILDAIETPMDDIINR